MWWWDSVNGGGFQRTVKEREAEEGCVCWTLIVVVGGALAQDAVTLKGVNADWAKAHQRVHVRTLTAEGPDGIYC